MPAPVQTTATVERDTRQALARKLLDLQNPLIVHVSPHMMRTVTSLVSIRPNVREKWVARIDQREVEGTANHPGFLLAWKRLINSEFQISARDPSRSAIPFEMLYAYFFPNAGVENYWKLNPYWLVKELAVEGQAAIVSGDRGYGKTDHALHLSTLLALLKRDQREWAERGDIRKSHFYQIRREQKYQTRYERFGFGGGGEKKKERRENDAFSSRLGLYVSEDVRFPTNISISPKSEFAEYYQPCSKMSEFVLAMCRNAKAGIFSLPLADEMGFSFNKRRAMTATNFAIEQLLIVIRKFNAGLLVIAQSVENQLPLSLTGSAQTKVQKISKDTAIYDVRGLYVFQRVRDIPSTFVRYATRAFAPFAVDFVPNLMVEDVAKKETEARENGIEWTDEMMYDAAIEFCTTKRLSAAELAKGGSAVLRSEVEYFANQIDVATGRLYTPKRISQEVEGATEEKVIEILNDIRKRKGEAREAAKGRASYSAPVA